MANKKLAKNWPLIIAILLPIFMIALVFLSVAVPSLLIKPRYDFIYTLEDYSYSYYDYEYDVTNGTLTKKPINNNYRVHENYSGAPDSSVEPDQYPDLYRYDVSQNKSQPVTFSDASKMKLIDSKTSPDNFQIETASGGGGVLFFGGYSGSSGGYYLKNGLSSHKLVIDEENYRYDFRFIGWVSK